MSSTFITSDLHLGHANVINYCPESRGHFTSVDEMNNAIVSNINSVVTDNDVLIIVGDIAFAKPNVAMDFLKQINGQKILIWGNHDSKLRNSSVFENERRIAGVVGYADYMCETFVVDGVRHKAAIMHFPLLSWDRMHHGSFMFHGHGHAPKSKRDTMPGKRIRDIGLDGNDMMPYRMDELIRELSSRPSNFYGHHDGSRD